MISIFGLIIMISIGTTLPLTIKGIKHLLQNRKTWRRDKDLFLEFVYEDFFSNLTVSSIDKNLDGLDLKILDTDKNFEFLIKCHYQDRLNDNSIIWCTNNQIAHYKKLKIPVFVMIGIGGPAHFPDQLFLIPFKYLSSNTIDPVELDQYIIKYNQKIDVSLL